MKASLVMIGLVIGLAGCANVPNVPQTASFYTESGYGTVQTGMKLYRQLPWCPAKIQTPGCETRINAESLRSADKAVRTALTNLEKVSRSGDSLSIQAATAAAQQAISDATGIYNSIKGAM